MHFHCRAATLLHCMAGYTLFSQIDMKCGYHQVEILESHMKRTLGHPGKNRSLSAHFNDHRPFYAIRHGFSKQELTAR